MLREARLRRLLTNRESRGGNLGPHSIFDCYMIASLFILAQQSPTGGFDPSFFIMMGLIFVVFYFFIIRPQRKREDKRKEMIGAVQKGDKIITAGGIHATVIKVDDTSVLAQVDENVKLRFEKSAISAVPSQSSAG